MYTQAPITYNSHNQKVKPFTNFVNLTPYKPSTPVEMPEEEREGKLVVEEDDFMREIDDQEEALEQEINLEEPFNEVVLDELEIEIGDVDSTLDDASNEVETQDPLGPPEKGRTSSGIMRPFVDLGQEIVEGDGLVQSEKLVIEPILITSTEPTTTQRTISSSTSPPSTTSTARAPTTTSNLPTTTTTTVVDTTTTETPTSTTTSSERMEKLLEMAMERLKEMEETLESS